MIGRHRAPDAGSLWELLNLGSPDETAWMADAVCVQTDPDAFFPERDRSDPRPAKAMCQLCPVRAACLAYALARGERHGVWGGLSPDERSALRRGRGTAPDEGVAA